MQAVYGVFKVLYRESQRPVIQSCIKLALSHVISLERFHVQSFFKNYFNVKILFYC